MWCAHVRPCRSVRGSPFRVKKDVFYPNPEDHVQQQTRSKNVLPDSGWGRYAHVDDKQLCALLLEPLLRMTPAMLHARGEGFHIVMEELVARPLPLGEVHGS